jgi:phosphoenolpyruvate-protein phosphotransferase (PTS system enzyme I)
MSVISKGNAVSKGIGMGYAYIYKQYVATKHEILISAGKVDEEISAYQTTRQQAEREIEGIRQFLENKKDEKSKIFTAHLDILNDVAIAEEIENFIKNEHYSYPYAIHTVYDMFIEMLSQVEDDLIKERVADLKDVRNRLIRISDHVEEANLARLSRSSIVFAEDLYPSDTATLDRTMVEAIVTEVGGQTSHTAIIAKSYEIPAILGVEHVTNEIKSGDFVIVDAISNKIIINPEDSVIESYKQKQKAYRAKLEMTKAYLDQQPITKDNIKVEVSINIGSASQDELSFEKYVDGVGLFRSEFLYMENTHMPTEEEQFVVYRKALEAFGKKPLILRTLDIGGDKELSYMTLPKEENPFLGSRAIRLCFDHMDLFKTQLRAALRASIYGNLWLMFPMVGSMDDVDQIKSVVEDVKSSLDLDGIPYSVDHKIGIMIEIPSIILVADHVAKAVDFASIGTNDLCQYLTAVDRMNPLVSKYYQSYSPSMFRIIKMAVDAFNVHHKPISVCGELGGDPVAAPVLLGLGMRKLSMNKTSVPLIKKIITTHTMNDFAEVAQHVLNLRTEKEVIDYVKSTLSLED